MDNETDSSISMMDYKSDKSFRLLHMQNLLNKGIPIRKGALAAEMGVNPKSIQRDIDSLRLYLAETGGGELVYSRKYDHYTLERNSSDSLTVQEVYALCKVLIESRALRSSFSIGVCWRPLLTGFPLRKSWRNGATAVWC